MIGIVDVGTTLGSVECPNLDKFPGGADLEFLERTVGILRTYHKRPEQTATDLCMDAFEDLRIRRTVDVSKVDVLVVVSQHTRANIPPISATLSGKLGLRENLYCLDLSIGCTGFVQGLHTALSLMKSLGATGGLLFNVETLSEVLSPDDPATNYIFSDGASCTLLGVNEAFAYTGEFDFGTSGARCLALTAQTSELQMDGLEIYKFATAAVPQSLHRLLRKAQLNLSDLDFIFFHQASLRTVNKLKDSFVGVSAPYDILSYGNTASCSIPFLLKKHRSEILSGRQKKSILSSFGSGLSFANCVIAAP